MKILKKTALVVSLLISISGLNAYGETPKWKQYLDDTPVSIFDFGLHLLNEELRWENAYTEAYIDQELGLKVTVESLAQYDPVGLIQIISWVSPAIEKPPIEKVKDICDAVTGLHIGRFLSLGHDYFDKYSGYPSPKNLSRKIKKATIIIVNVWSKDTPSLKCKTRLNPITSKTTYYPSLLISK